MKKQGLLSVLIVLICFLILKQLIFVALDEYNENNFKIQNKTREIDLIRQIMDKAKDFSNNFDPENMSKFSIYFPSVFNQETYITQINAMAIANNMILEKLDLNLEASSNQNNQDKQATEIKKISITAGLSGKYENFRKLLIDIEKNLPLFDVSNFSISAPNNVVSDYFKFDFKINTYLIL